MSAKYFLRDQQGSVLVEVTIMLSVTLVLVLGAIDFLLPRLGPDLPQSRTLWRRALTASVKRL